MKFIIDPPEEKRPTFEDVEENHLFINGNRELCQKVSPRFYNVIANSGGTLFAAQRDNRVFPVRVLKIIIDVRGIEF